MTEAQWSELLKEIKGLKDRISKLERFMELQEPILDEISHEWKDHIKS